MNKDTIKKRWHFIAFIGKFFRSEENNSMQATLLLFLADIFTLLVFAGSLLFSWNSYNDTKKAIQQTNNIAEMKGSVLLYNEVLTMSAKMASVTGNLYWEERYNIFKLKLDTTLQKLTTVIPEMNAWESAKKTQIANEKLVAIEKQAFEAVKRGQLDEAQSLLVGSVYKKQKEVYTEGMLQVGKDLNKASEKIIKKQKNQFIILISILIVAISLLVIAWLITYRKFKNLIKKLTTKNQQLVASEQQLRAYNQQLDANNQQLRATEQQLKAANQQQKANEVVLKAREERLDLAMMISNEGTWDWNLVTNQVNFDERYYTMAGYDPGDFAHNLEEFQKRIHREDVDYVMSTAEQYLAGQIDQFQVEFRFKRKDGTWMWIQGRGQIVERDEKGIPLRFIGTHSDITERKQAGEKLKESEERYRALFEKEENAIFIYEPDTLIIVDANSAMTNTYGYSYDELIGMNCLKLSAEREKSETVASEVKKKGNVDVNLRWHKKKDGTVFPLELQVYQTELEGETVGYAVARDISERIQAEKEKQDLQEQLNHKSKMDAIGALAGGMAHDFNNVLSGIMSASQLLQLPKQGLNGKSLKYVDMILQASRRASDLIRKLLTFSRKGHVATSTFNIHDVLDDTVDILKGTIDKKITISLTKEAYNYNLIGDKSAIESVLLNLGINASHAMPDGGEIRISTKNIFLDQKYCGSSSFTITPGDFIQIRIKDSGCGIPEENLQKIFDPFFTTKEQGQGTGLGLSTVYGTIENHHGAIEVNSKVEKGSTFYILLPCSQQSVPQIEENDQTAKGTGTILLVDDEEFNRILNQEILETLGYGVLLAADGKEAVEVFREKHSEIDIVLMDMIMPGMNGSEAFYKMKEIDETCHVIITSGYTKDEKIDELLENGVKGFIKKPYKISEISRVLDKVDR